MLMPRQGAKQTEKQTVLFPVIVAFGSLQTRLRKRDCNRAISLLLRCNGGSKFSNFCGAFFGGLDGAIQNEV
ncbi:hypothetical protein B1R32_107134 [Abditibacterium utsteinense]|uniref:Uncharacterized protein n=1 Tax=Abditibacterium utsteinense TaxID=1960156 RepID=A0A2S8STP1_9BACT|nr:hypothetical protein B1R32_107134 [Abditibacterium utsteinense]